MITIAELRRKYPNPMTMAQYRRSVYPETAYCVGGALCLELGGRKNNFPEGAVLSRYIREVDPDLSKRYADGLADVIIDANDVGDFETAWRLLGEVLP